MCEVEETTQNQSGGKAIIRERAVRQQNRQVVVIHAPAHFAYDPVVERYEELFGWLDWSVVTEPDDNVPRRGRLPHPEAAYIKAYRVMVNQKIDYQTDARRGVRPL